jgi:hypothetical protein
METVAASWQGAVRVTLRVETRGVGRARVERDFARIELIPWSGAGVACTLYDGPVGDPTAASLYPGIKSWHRKAQKA